VCKLGTIVYLGFSVLAMRCCSLALILVRRISDASQKVMTDASKGTKKKASSLDLQQRNEDDTAKAEALAEERMEALQAAKAAGKAPSAAQMAEMDEREKQKEHEQSLSRITNVKQQVQALLSFKEALCSGKP
jgi:uncharacterized membrane protein YhiD involved in acid resistance